MMELNPTHEEPHLIVPLEEPTSDDGKVVEIKSGNDSAEGPRIPLGEVISLGLPEEAVPTRYQSLRFLDPSALTFLQMRVVTNRILELERQLNAFPNTGRALNGIEVDPTKKRLRAEADFWREKYSQLSEIHSAARQILNWQPSDFRIYDSEE